MLYCAFKQQRRNSDKAGQATVKDDQERAIQIRHLQIITSFIFFNLFYLAEEMLEKQP